MCLAQKKWELLLLDVSGKTSAWCSGYHGLAQGKGESYVEEMVQEKNHLIQVKKGQVENNQKREIGWAWRDMLFIVVTAVEHSDGSSSELSSINPL